MNKEIQDLQAASAISVNDLTVLKQLGSIEAKKATIAQLVELIFNTLDLDLAVEASGFIGMATPSTNPDPPTVGYWIATEAGTYTYMGGVVVNASSLAIIVYTGSNWLISQTAINMADYVLKSVFEAIFQSTSKGLLNIVDAAGNYGGGLNEQGELDFFKISTNLRKAVETALGFSITKNGIYSITDAAGLPAIGIAKNGEFFVIKFTKETENYIIDLAKSAIEPQIPKIGVTDLSLYSDVNHIITYGQSLSVGQNETVISTTSLYPNLICFDGVVRTSPYDLSLTGDEYPTNRRIAFTQIKERVNDGTAPNVVRETPTTGTLEMLALEINKFAFNTFPTLGIKLLGSASGWGATTISQLSKGGIYYDRLIADVQAGYNLSLASGKQYKCLCVTWTQGESDYIQSTTYYTYLTLAKKLLADINADVKAITKQNEDVIIVMYQVATSNGGGKAYPNIALAQLELCLNEKGFYMAVPMYNMNYNDGFHVKSESAKLLGSYYGYTINKVLSQKIDWKPLHPVAHTVQGNLIKLKFYVPVLPLAFDVAGGVTLANKGFKVIVGGADILTSVSLGSDGDSVNLLCSSSPVGGMIQYGINTTAVTNSVVNLGNLRDSQGNTQTVTIAANNLRMDNWAAIFERLV